MQPVQTVYTDKYQVPCPHECGVTVSVEVTRERGGRVLDIHIVPCSNALPGALTDRLTALPHRRE